MKKKSNVWKIILGIVLILAIAAGVAFGVYKYVKSSIVGTYYIQSFNAEYMGIKLSADYEDGKWKTEGATSFLKNFVDIDEYLDGYDNHFAYLTINEDGTYSYSIAGFITGESSGDSSNSGNYRIEDDSIVFDQDDFEVRIKKNIITVKDKNYEITFQKE